MLQVTFNNKKSPFLKALKAKVDTYFSDNKVQISGNRKLYFKSLVQTLSAACIYTVLVFFTPGIFISVVLCALFGVNLALLGFNVMHEGAHQSFSKHAWLNKASAYTLNVLGGNVYFWKIKHNLNHHTFTNIEGMDSDIETGNFMRLHDNQPRLKLHRFQHIYWPFLYGFTYFQWVFINDFTKYFTGKIVPGTPYKKLKRKEHFIFWTTKISYICVYIVLPVLMLGILKALVGFAIVTFVCGLFISTVFQLAHVVKDTHFPQPDMAMNKIDEEWAIHQIHTTANFGVNSKLLMWMLGGLNFQVEHHLFPKVSHVHYPKISQFVRETCEQFNVTYIVYPTAAAALRSHVLHIKRLGKKVKA